MRALVAQLALSRGEGLRRQCSGDFTVRCERKTIDPLDDFARGLRRAFHVSCQVFNDAGIDAELAIGKKFDQQPGQQRIVYWIDGGHR